MTEGTWEKEPHSLENIEAKTLPTPDVSEREGAARWTGMMKQLTFALHVYVRDKTLHVSQI